MSYNRTGGSSSAIQSERLRVFQIPWTSCKSKSFSNNFSNITAQTLMWDIMAFKCALMTFLILYASEAIGSNVLIAPLDGEGSHYRSVKLIAQELIKRGHNITFLIDDRFEDVVKENGDFDRFHYEIFKSNFTLSEYHDFLTSLTQAGLKGEFLKWIMEVLSTDFTERQVSDCDNLLGNTVMMERLRTFDLAIVDMTLQCPVMQYLTIPFVVFSPGALISCGISLANRMPFNPSYMPEFATALDHKMTLGEKLKNTMYALFFGFVVAAFANPYDEVKHRYGLGNKSMLYTDAEMWLVNTDFALDFPRPLLPNTVTIGGLTTRPGKVLTAVSIVYFVSGVRCANDT